MKVDELRAVTERALASRFDTQALIAEVDRLQKREVELLQRTLDAELEVRNLGIAWRQTAEERDQWRLRWTRAQEQVGRWCQAQGRTQDELAMVDAAMAGNLERHADTRDVVAGLWEALEAVVAQCRYDCTRESNCGVCAIAFKALAGSSR